uniref:DUF834 domain-containing protein n=1 Tax=Oryza barthii TaxID=65489 RepID=A0A0D3G8A0_9ORYZ
MGKASHNATVYRPRVSSATTSAEAWWTRRAAREPAPELTSTHATVATNKGAWATDGELGGDEAAGAELVETDGVDDGLRGEDGAADQPISRSMSSLLISLVRPETTA